MNPKSLQHRVRRGAPLACRASFCLWLLGLLLILPIPAARAATVQVAVAANFSGTLQRLAPLFQQASGHTLQVSAGSTGKLVAQIRNGAPFDVFLAADAETPAQLEAEGLAVAASRVTYAVGRLVLWSPDPARIDGRPDVLKAGNFRHLAMANPRVAPYGQAAQQTLEKLNLAQTLAPRLVLGESIAQAHQFVASGNAELGFVALAQVMTDGQLGAGSFWLVPPSLHAPLRQDAVWLRRARDAAAAQALLAFLRSAAARAVIAAAGYALP